MLSEQMGQTITGINYRGLNKVYSIWICISTPLKRANTIYRTRSISESLSGSKEEEGRYDLAQCIFIRLPDEERKKKPENEPTELMTVLSALFSTKMSATEKKKIFQEHGIAVTTEMEEGINSMCNLSEGIFNNGRRVGREEGRKEGREEEHKKTLKEKRRADAAEQQVRELKLQLAALK